MIVKQETKRDTTETKQDKAETKQNKSSINKKTKQTLKKRFFLHEITIHKIVSGGLKNL